MFWGGEGKSFLCPPFAPALIHASLWLSPPTGHLSRRAEKWAPWAPAPISLCCWEGDLADFERIPNAQCSLELHQSRHLWILYFPILKKNTIWYQLVNVRSIDCLNSSPYYFLLWKDGYFGQENIPLKRKTQIPQFHIVAKTLWGQLQTGSKPDRVFQPILAFQWACNSMICAFPNHIFSVLLGEKSKPLVFTILNDRMIMSEAILKWLAILLLWFFCRLFPLLSSPTVPQFVYFLDWRDYVCGLQL